jgi:hypothetical protein
MAKFKLMLIYECVPTSKITWELPHNVPFEAKEALMKESIDRWRQPSLTCFLGVFNSTSEFVERLLKEHFGRFKQLERYIRYENRPTVRCHADVAVRLTTRAELDSHKERGSQALEKALEREQFPLFEGDTNDFNSARKEWLAIYKAQRYNDTRRTPQDRPYSPVPLSAQHTALNALSNIGYTGLTFDDLKQRLDSYRLEPADEFEDELVVMAEVQAYFKVAHKVSAHPGQYFRSLTQSHHCSASSIPSQ